MRMSSGTFVVDVGGCPWESGVSERWTMKGIKDTSARLSGFVTGATAAAGAPLVASTGSLGSWRRQFLSYKTANHDFRDILYREFEVLSSVLAAVVESRIPLAVHPRHRRACIIGGDLELGSGQCCGKYWSFWTRTAIVLGDGAAAVDCLQTRLLGRDVQMKCVVCQCPFRLRAGARRTAATAPGWQQ